MTVKEIENIFLKETTLTDMLLSLLNENADYSNYINEIINETIMAEDTKNEWYYVQSSNLLPS